MKASGTPPHGADPARAATTTGARSALARATQAILLPKEALLTTAETVRVVSMAIYRTLMLLAGLAAAGVAWYLRSGGEPGTGDPRELASLQATGLRLWIAMAAALLLLWPLERRLRWLQIPNRLLVWTLGFVLVAFGGWFHFMTADPRPMVAGLVMLIVGIVFFPIRAR